MPVLIFLVSTSEGSFRLSLLPYYSFLSVHPGSSGLVSRSQTVYRRNGLDNWRWTFCSAFHRKRVSDKWLVSAWGIRKGVNLINAQVLLSSASIARVALMRFTLLRILHNRTHLSATCRPPYFRWNTEQLSRPFLRYTVWLRETTSGLPGRRGGAASDVCIRSSLS